jgi:hypothetical protein
VPAGEVLGGELGPDAFAETGQAEAQQQKQGAVHHRVSVGEKSWSGDVRAYKGRANKFTVSCLQFSCSLTGLARGAAHSATGTGRAGSAKRSQWRKEG